MKNELIQRLIKVSALLDEEGEDDLATHYLDAAEELINEPDSDESDESEVTEDTEEISADDFKSMLEELGIEVN
jgi:hypothetical protein